MDSIDIEALFCDETGAYRWPEEADPDETVTFYFRTAREGADAVYFVAHDQQGLTRRYPMKLLSRDEQFDYYSVSYIVGEETLFYNFHIEKGGESCEYDRAGVGGLPYRMMFRLTPGFHVPEWSKGAVMYQIFTDRFCNGDPANDVVDGEYYYLGRPVCQVNWDEPTAELDVGRFYGGDLAGVLKKLDYLKDLGVEAIYLNPVFVSPSNHKYDCQDYSHIDPHYTVIPEDADNPQHAGSNREREKYVTRTTDLRNLRASDRYFADFVKQCHEHGIRVIIDGVFNHCGSFNRWMDRERIYEKHGGYPIGAFISGNSPYRNFFQFNDPNGWPYNTSYDGWWGNDTLPKLNYEASPELEQYILDIAKKWVSPPYSCDGWRLDVAADVGHSAEFNHHFWKKFREAVKSANPDAVIIAEHYGDPSDWLGGDEWDSVMNYDAFMEPVSWFLTGMEKHSDSENPSLKGDGQAFFHAMRTNMFHMQSLSVACAMNQLSNHDHSRFMTRTNRRVGRLANAGFEAAGQGVNIGIFRQGVVMQMTWPGAPTYYYGDEAGLCGWTDPDSRRTYPWGHENLELIEFCHIVTFLRREIKALRRGSILCLAAEQGLVVYGRFLRGKNASRCVVAVNTDDCWKKVQIPVWRIGVRGSDVLRRRMLTYESGYNVGIIEFPVADGMVSIDLPPVSSMILEAKPTEEQFAPTVLSGEWVSDYAGKIPPQGGSAR